MRNERRIPGQFVDAVSVADVLASTGMQLLSWANDIAFTDAAFGEKWALETANRMATLSQVLHDLYEILGDDVKDIQLKLPDGVVGVMAINPNFKKDSAKPSLSDEDLAAYEGGVSSSITELPF